MHSSSCGPTAAPCCINSLTSSTTSSIAFFVCLSGPSEPGHTFFSTKTRSAKPELDEARTSTNVACLTSASSTGFVAGGSDSPAVSPASNTCSSQRQIHFLSPVSTLLTVGLCHLCFSGCHSTAAAICESVKLKFHILGCGIDVARPLARPLALFDWRIFGGMFFLRPEWFSRRERFVVHDAYLVSLGGFPWCTNNQFLEVLVAELNWWNSMDATYFEHTSSRANHMLHFSKSPR